MVDWSSVIIAGLGALSGGVLTKFSDFLIKRKKEQTDHELRVAEQPVQQYSDLVDRLEKRITVLEADHRECMDKHADARFELGKLHGMLDEQRAQLQSMRASSSQENQEAIKTAAVLAQSSLVKSAEIAERNVERVVAAAVDAVKSTSDSAIRGG